MLILPKPVDDGLLTPVVNPWSREKHHFLARYINAFTTAMKGKAWSGLHYIDLFAGAGLERIKDTDELEWGSPLIAAHAAHSFAQLHLVEKDAAKANALRARLVRVRGHERDQVVSGDANESALAVVSAIPPKSLALAFLDPYGLHLHYETVRSLSLVRADLIIYFPDRLDADRNWQEYYWDNPASNLDAILGPDSHWRERIAAASPSTRSTLFVDLYEAQLKKLGYAHFEREGIPSSRNRLYWLIFCSRAAIGAKIWRGVAQKKPDGQRAFEY